MKERLGLVAAGFVRDGALFIHKREGFNEAVQRMPNCRAVIRLEQALDPRSVALNAYYWAVVVHLVSEETGYDDVETHRLLKELHLPKRFAALRGNGRIDGVRVFDGSTTDLSNPEEWEYIENIQRWSAVTLRLVIPDPLHV